MFRIPLSSLIKIATLPIDATNAGLDVLCGGDGSKQSRTQDDSPGALVEKLRDAIAKAAKDIDE